MEKIWFVSIEDVISGPLTTAEAEAKVKMALQPALLWWRGQSHWIPHKEWRDNRDQILRALKEAQQGSQRYYLSTGAETEGPFNKRELEDRLKNEKNFDRVYLWSDDKKRWVSIFEFPNFCELLGITRRQHPRVPLRGTAILTKDQVEMHAEITSVSIGGCGIKVDPGHSLVGVFSVALRSPKLFNVIKTRAEVAHVKADGQIGLKFLSLSVENQAAIVQYVRSFEEESQLQSA